MSAIQICIIVIYFLGIFVTVYLLVRYGDLDLDDHLVPFTLVSMLWPVLLLPFMIYAVGKLGEKHRSKK